MLFSSFDFLLGFLPFVILLFLLFRHFQWQRAAIVGLSAASWVFYAAWNPAYLPLLLGSIILNYLIGVGICAKGRYPWLPLGVSLNLGLLGMFKYAGFIGGDVLGFRSPVELALPLAISFFTFQQIAWLVDLDQRKVTIPTFRDYAFFVSFFPQLIAGPIVRAQELFPQLTAGWLKRPIPWSMGMAFLCIGLAKKVLVADTLGPGVDAIYMHAEEGGSFDLWQVWSAAAGYGAQLYFDFSGYADMAIGLALLFGIRLPFNFLSPYKATSIIDFWRRWHITLSDFLRDYLYIPLGGNRKGRTRRYINLMITMLLGGLWHGAGWQFILWGGLHGSFLVINHLWRTYCRWQLPLMIASLLTLSVVLLAWIPFRAVDLATTGHIFAGIFRLPALEGWFSPRAIAEALVRLDATGQVGWLAIPALLLARLAPATHNLVQRLNPFQRGLLVGTLLLMVLKTLAERPDRAFLYFNF